jgi:tetratricopeptide (TPR) repeat protein
VPTSSDVPASTNAPQADRIPAIRQVVACIERGVQSTEQLEKAASLSERHVRYYLQAARILGWIELVSDTPSITISGKQILETPEGSRAERILVATAISTSPHLQKVAGDVLVPTLTVRELAERLRRSTGISASTAKRRAESIFKWRKYVEELDPAPAIEVKSGGAPQVENGRSGTATRVPLLAANSAAFLSRQMEQGKLVLFTGAGFSADATDYGGNRIPTSDGLSRELWAVAFADAPFEPATPLQDAFAVAVRKKKTAVTELLRRRFSVRSETLPAYYAHWFSMPWRKIYTLNIDDLAMAAARAFSLPRRPKLIRAIPALAGREPAVSYAALGEEVPILHLHGTAVDGPDGVTFSRRQYASRASDPDPAYAQLAVELLGLPFVFVGTPLDEPLLWQHIELRQQRAPQGVGELRPRNFLVVPTLSRAKQSLLEEYNITWVPATAEQFAEQILAPMERERGAGLSALNRLSRASVDSQENVHDVTELRRLDEENKSRSEYLQGDEPRWIDIVSARAVKREVDDTLRDAASEAVRRGKNVEGRVIVITGTAGSGKSTAAMRLALQLSADGFRVGWVEKNTEVSPRTLLEFAGNENAFPVVVIDDADRYGPVLPGLVRDLVQKSRIRLVIVSARAGKMGQFETDPAVEQLSLQIFVMPHLTDGDISALLDALKKDHRLGRLVGMARSEQETELRREAGRQLLVAMIEATSGRKFDEKVLTEWEEMSSVGKLFYALIAVATALRYDVTQVELLLAARASSASGDLAELSKLADRKIVIHDKERLTYRARHRVIAEKLVEELARRGNVLRTTYENLAYAVSAFVSPDQHPTARPRRFLKQLLNHDSLFRALDLEGARGLYGALESTLHWDHHYWLQRGSLEVEEGDLRQAEQFLSQAFSLAPDDKFVETEYAYMRMKKATTAPEAPEAPEWLEDGLTRLRTLITSQKRRDPHPFHIIGSQSIAWSSRSRWPKEQRKAFLLKALDDVEKGLQFNPMSNDLRQLHTDMKKAVLQFALL